MICESLSQASPDETVSANAAVARSASLPIVVLFGRRLLPERQPRCIAPDFSGHARTLIKQYELDHLKRLQDPGQSYMYSQLWEGIRNSLVIALVTVALMLVFLASGDHFYGIMGALQRISLS